MLNAPAQARLGGALNALTGMFGRATNQIILLIVTLLAARWLTPTSFGAYSIAAALVTLSRAMLYAGAFEYLLKAPPGQESNTECLVVNLVLAAGLGGVLAMLSFFARPIFHSAEVAVLLLVLAPSSLLSATANWQESQLLRSGRIKAYYGVTTTAEVIAAVVTITLIVLGFGLVALVAQIYARLFSLTIAYRVLQRPIWSRGFSVRTAWSIGRWSTARYGATVTAFLSNYSADIFLGAFLSPAATGLYRASHRMVSGVSDLVGNPSRVLAMTLFSRQAAEGEEVGSSWAKIAAASAFFGWTALAGLAAIATQAAPLILGQRWRAAGPLIAILCLQRAFALIDGVTGPLLVAYNHARALLSVQLVVALASVAALFIVARFGAVVVAGATSLAAGLSMVACAALASRRFPGLFSALPRALPVGLGPPLAAGLAAWITKVALERSGGSGLEAVLWEIAAGVGGFAVAALVLRLSVVDVLDALNAPRRDRAGAGHGAPVAAAAS